MESLRSYVLSIVCAAIVCGILSDLSAKTGFAKLIHLCCSIFLAYTFVNPLLSFRLSEWTEQKDAIIEEAEDAAAQGENIRLQSVAAIIRQEAEAYILEEAKSIGASLEVHVELDNGNPPVPAAVTIQGDFDASVESQLSALLTDELGIPKEQQTWIRQQSHSSDNSSPNTSTSY